MATLIHTGEILTRTHVRLGLPAMGPLHPHTHVGYLMATAHPHLPHIDGDLQGHPTHTTGLPMSEGPARAFMNLTVRQMRMIGASDHRVYELQATEENENHRLQCSGQKYENF